MHTDQSILNRKTTKVLTEVDLPTKDINQTLADLVKLAGMAPFHRACDEAHRSDTALRGIEPWRFHLVDAANCRRLKRRIPLENAGKIPAMLAAADALILATWLPNLCTDVAGLFDPTLANMEHIAATSAAVQNLLLAATARGISTYWSSGGILRDAEVFRMLGIRDCEVLLAAIFLFPTETGTAEVVGSKLRAHRCQAANWSRSVAIDEPDDGMEKLPE
jgi:nitroreductase